MQFCSGLNAWKIGQEGSLVGYRDVCELFPSSYGPCGGASVMTVACLAVVVVGHEAHGSVSDDGLEAHKDGEVACYEV